MTEETREFASVRQTLTVPVEEVAIGDEFWFQGYLYWTALADASRTNIGWSVRVLYPDGSFGARYWRSVNRSVITIARIAKVHP